MSIALPDDLVELLSTRTAPRTTLDVRAPVTGAIRVLLTEADRIEVREQFAPPLRRLWEGGDEVRQTWIETAAAVMTRPDLAERLNAPYLPGGQVDDHDLGALLGATLDCEGADLVVSALEAAGVELIAGAVLIDCGTGQAARLRALGAARPDLRLSGIDDPNGLPTNATADVAVALDLLTARDAQAAVQAIGRLRRALRVGGRALLTVAGLNAVAAAIQDRTLSPAAASSALRELYRTGHHRAGDRAFVTLDWFAGHVIGTWAVLWCAPGAIADDRDVLVIERRR